MIEVEKREFWLNTRLERIYKDSDASCPGDEIHVVNHAWHLLEMERVNEKLEHCRVSNKQKSDDYFKQMMRISALTAKLELAEYTFEKILHEVGTSTLTNKLATEALKELKMMKESK